MDISNIHNQIEYTRGCNLNIESVTQLQNALYLLQNDNHFKGIYFWGKITGAICDYFIAYGFETDVIRNRKFFYTNDLKDWSMMPKAKMKYKHALRIATKPLVGDASLKFKIVNDEIPKNEPGHCIEMKEEYRLAALVETISDECEIVCRGQLIKQPDCTYVYNNKFAGMSVSDARKLKSYMHCRVPQNKWNTNLLTRPDYNYSLDCLDTIDGDIPNGCWKIFYEQRRDLVFVRNMYWQGMLYYHRLMTPDAGFVYVGDGFKNLDVPFYL